MHKIVFKSRRVARTYVGVFDWLVSHVVCDCYVPFELSFDRPNTTNSSWQETDWACMWLWNLTLTSSWTIKVFLALFLRSLCSVWSIIHYDWANFFLQLSVSHLEVVKLVCSMHIKWLVTAVFVSANVFWQDLITDAVSFTSVEA